MSELTCADRGFTPGAEIAASTDHVAKIAPLENPFKSAGAMVNELIRENVPVDEPCTALHNSDTLSHNANDESNAPSMPKIFKLIFRMRTSPRIFLVEITKWTENDI